MNEIIFEDRIDAGEKLAKEMIQQKLKLKNPVVLGIPRGGVPIGYVLAKKLGGELDTIVLRKIPIPQDPEAGYGAVTLDKTVILNKELLPYIHLTKEEMENGIENVYQEVLRRNEIFERGNLSPI
jgi:putative phosphoribosyl transferase